MLVKIVYACICHSDIHTARGEWGDTIYPFPVTRLRGTVEEIGSSVTNYALGDRVGVGVIVDLCRTCENCLAGNEQYCLNGVIETYGAIGKDGRPTEGGYSTHIVVDEDPGLDIDGHDAAHKLVVLAMLAFGARVESERVPTEGIRAIDSIDHAFADRFGFTIKHLAIGRDRGDAVELRVHPALVKKTSTIANVGGVLNAIALEGRALGPCLLSGRGAGDMPTAVSVVADVVDVARAR